MRHIQPHLKPLLPHEPVPWTFVLGKRPFVESSRHQRLIAPEVYQGSNAEWGNQLPSSDRSTIRHTLC